MYCCTTAEQAKATSNMLHITSLRTDTWSRACCLYGRCMMQAQVACYHPSPVCWPAIPPHMTHHAGLPYHHHYTTTAPHMTHHLLMKWARLHLHDHAHTHCMPVCTLVRSMPAARHAAATARHAARYRLLPTMAATAACPSPQTAGRRLGSGSRSSSRRGLG